MEEEQKRRESGANTPGVHGTVLAVNQAYNFVVLSMGDRQGVVPNSEMLVLRSGSLIGKIRISSVEPTTSIGDIITNSLARGVQVQPGDTVIYAGSTIRRSISCLTISLPPALRPSSCATRKRTALINDPDAHRSRAIPWNEPQKWESGANVPARSAAARPVRTGVGGFFSSAAFRFKSKILPGSPRPSAPLRSHRGCNNSPRPNSPPCLPV